MADAFLDQFIADLVKGASSNLRENGGPGVNIVVAKENRGHEEKLAAAREARGALEQRYNEGTKAAAAALGIKEAFLGALAPLAGSVLGGTAMRAGAGALAKRGAGSMIGGLAAKALPHMTGGIGGAATDAIGGMAGGALGQKLQGAPQQQ